MADPNLDNVVAWLEESLEGVEKREKAPVHILRYEVELALRRLRQVKNRSSEDPT